MSSVSVLLAWSALHRRAPLSKLRNVVIGAWAVLALVGACTGTENTSEGVSLEQFNNTVEEYRRCTAVTNCDHTQLTDFAPCLCDIKYDAAHRDEILSLASRVVCEPTDPDYTLGSCEGSADSSFCNADGFCEAVPAATPLRQ